MGRDGPSRAGGSRPRRRSARVVSTNGVLAALTSAECPLVRTLSGALELWREGRKGGSRAGGQVSGRKSARWERTTVRSGVAAAAASDSARFDCNFCRAVHSGLTRVHGAVSERCATMTRAPRRRDNWLGPAACCAPHLHLVTVVRWLLCVWWPLQALLLLCAGTCGSCEVDVVATCYADCGSRLVSCRCLPRPVS